MTPNRRQRVLRASFVVTFAAGALASSCGSTVGPGTGSDASVDVRQPGDTINPPPPSCPTEAPADGAPCPPYPFACPYGDCSGHPTTTAQCSGGTWRVLVSSCNPPDAGADVVATPDAAPAPDAVTTDAGEGSCAALGCTGGDVCVRTLVEGGVYVAPDDAGTCPAGWIATDAGRPCRRPYTFRCAPRPAECTAALTCACAHALCVSCAGVAANEVDCVTPVP